MNRSNSIDLSVVIPVYNAEKYLAVCIDSLMHQEGIRIEIILVNDGSTDRSGEIVDEYAERDNRIKAIHQANRGASAARNTGMDAAQGEYIAFFDSDDWVKEGSLPELYCEAIRHQADVVMGNIWLCRQDGSIESLFKQVSGELSGQVLPGKEGFCRLVEIRLYLPMPFKYICRRRYLQEIHARFEEGIMHEDELWTPFVLYQAERMVISDIAFYYYRQSEESVMHTTHLHRRLESLFRVTDKLIELTVLFDFSGEYGVLKNWWYVTVFRLYSKVFTLLGNVKDSSYTVPPHHLDRLWRDSRQMIPEAQQRCRSYYRDAEAGLKKYTDWLMSDWVAPVNYLLKSGKKLMLVYNTINSEELNLKIEDVPAGWVITTDRRYFRQADRVVFHLPSLFQEMENDLDKPEGQVWISWYAESENDHPLINDPEVRDLFNVWTNEKKVLHLIDDPNSLVANI
jgi:Glycosyltransferases involved in cell wall biogenesis